MTRISCINDETVMKVHLEENKKFIEKKKKKKFTLGQDRLLVVS